MALAVKDANQAETNNLLKRFPVKQPERDVDQKAREKALQAVRDISGEFVKQNQQLQLRMGLEADIAGYGEEEKPRILAQADLTKDYVGLIDQLVMKKQSLTKEEEYLIHIINEQLASASQLYETQRQGLDSVISRQQIASNNEKQREIAMEQITKQMERQATLGDQLRGANEKMNEALFENMQIRKSPMEQQLDKIKRDATEAGRQAGQAFAAGFDAMDMSVSQANELAKGLETISKAYEGIADQQAANFRLQQTVGEGMSSIMQNMNSAIDNFVTTGKFKFGDFARSVIQDLLKIELRAQASKLFSSMQGGISGFLGSLFGGFFANGGQPPVGKPSIVGENGPELFVPKTAGTIVPNGGGSSGADEFEVMCISADKSSAKSMDGIIDSLSKPQQTAINHQWLQVKHHYPTHELDIAEAYEKIISLSLKRGLV
jgi:lambda family phage tail tape measure protein